MMLNPMIKPQLDQTTPAAGPLYPGRCLQCPELLAESYGCTAPLRCVDCVAADAAGYSRQTFRVGGDGSKTQLISVRIVGEKLTT